jgi:cytochrome c2
MWEDKGMFKRVLAVCAIVAAVGTPSLALAQDSGDADKGLSYALHSCAFCHTVLKGDEASPDRLAPSFEEIANKADTTSMSLAAMLHSVHKNILSEQDRNNILAYILSLKR